MLDPGLSERREPPHVGSSNAHGVGAERDSLEDVGPAPESTVDKNRDLAVNHFNHIRQRLNRRSTALFTTTSMVRDNYSIGAVLKRESCVLGGDNAQLCLQRLPLTCTTEPQVLWLA